MPPVRPRRSVAASRAPSAPSTPRGNAPRKPRTTTRRGDGFGAPAPRPGPALRADKPRVDLKPGSVVYGVVPTLFGPEPFKAITQKLDYLKGQGVDALWLSPINKTDDPSAISYAITDFFKVREDFGTEQQFKTLVEEAHRRGMKVLLDFVPNHTSIEHPFFKDAQAKGKRSEHYDAYVRDAQGNPQHYFDWEHLKNLNYDDPKVQRHTIDAFKFWVQKFGVDGYRVDAAWGIQERSPGFWSKLSKELEAVKPDVFLLAEAGARDDAYVKSGFDAAYDWTGELGHWAWEKVFEDPKKVGPKLHEALTSGATPKDQIARFLNNNDTGERFISKYGLDTTRVAAVLMHAVPGVPIVYTGDEVGAEFQPYEDPEPISWDDPHGLRPLYKKLAELRETPALASGDFTSLPVKNTDAAYALHRDAGGKDQALVVLNFGPEKTLEIPLPKRLAKAAAKGALTDALTGKQVPVKVVGDTLQVKVGKSSAVILS
jgi:cyclomaltodextrinase / maltogenic alpha-amylase / neopullulanase